MNVKKSLRKEIPDDGKPIMLAEYIGEKVYNRKLKKVENGIERMKLFDPDFRQECENVQQHYLANVQETLSEAMEQIRNKIKTKFRCMTCGEDFEENGTLHQPCASLEKWDRKFARIEPSLTELLNAVKILANEDRLDLGLPTSINAVKNMDKKPVKELTSEELDSKIDEFQKRLKDRGLMIVATRALEDNSNQGFDKEEVYDN